MAVISYSRCKKCGGEIRDIDTGNQVYFEPCRRCAAQQSVQLTALRRGLAVSIFINVILLAVVAFTIGGN